MLCSIHLYRLADHFEDSPTTSLPRSALYSHYLEFCQDHNIMPLNQAGFGKVIKLIFPNVRSRRLGNRGNSRYILIDLYNMHVWITMVVCLSHTYRGQVLLRYIII